MGACQQGQNVRDQGAGANTCKAQSVEAKQVISGADTGGHVSTTAKAIKEIMRAPPAHWVGDGFNVYPVFNDLAFTKHVSPFLMFDYAAPKHFAPTAKQKGVGMHPHRGFETVTIAFQGEVEHGDSIGNTGVIGPGDVQWMTAGRGIVHKEHHSSAFARSGGTFEMCQLWVNLPREHKMSPPGYQEILHGDIPEVPLMDTDPDMAHGKVRVIAGAFRGARGPARTFTAVDMWDVRLATSGRTVELAMPAGHNTLIFVRKGSVRVGADGIVPPQGMVRLELAGSVVQLTALEADSQLLVLSGEPIDEPIASRGPFVMNTQKELAQAAQDYQSGVLGK